ncbi:histidine kinase [Burkholderiaceae bacterium FT117]|uniref:sensor histidine kinase n=1 Tax=Zeimonas sediminis TaxID=2944268 RepID=UPI0023432489|nr:histidine kinase [Zeimonas sediminis]MCM5569380.1 histidine kinase [Zeimonas sediminis]
MNDAQPPAPRRRRLTDGAALPVLPDCCNLGTVARVLLPLNVAVVLAAPLIAQDPGSAPDVALRAASVVNPVALLSLLVFCVARRIVNGWPRPAQWAAALSVPSVLAFLVALLVGWIYSSTPMASSLLERALFAVPLAAAATWLIAEFLRLRLVSLQPSQAEGRLQALQARIRPHFLFNSLNTVIGLMRSDARQAERTLENLADLFRVFMKDSRELVPLDDEVLLCKEYLTIEKLRLTDRLEVRWDLGEMPGDALLPSLLLQPLVENAVHHGIEPRTSPGEVRIAISRSGDRVRVEIANPLAEAPPVRSGNHMALSNVRERLALTFDVEGQLETQEDDGQFRVVVQFPYRKERRRRDVRRTFDPDR